MNAINQNTFRTPNLERVPCKLGRLYKLPDGRLVPSVSTILKVISKPALTFWSASEERKHCVASANLAFTEMMDSDFELTEVGAMQKTLAGEFSARLQQRLGRSFAHVRKSKVACNVGTEAHAAIEHWINERLGRSPGPFPALSDAAMVAFMSFQDWAKSVDFQPLAAEQIVYDPWQNYAGCYDWLARVSGVLTLGDNKTGRSIYRESYLQNAAYISSLRKQCRLGDEPIQGAIVRFPKELEDVTETPFEVKLISPEEHKANLLAFYKAKDLWHWVTEFKVEIPSPPAPRFQPRQFPVRRPWVKPQAPTRIPSPTGR